MKEYIKSPMNYTGGKYKLLDEILPEFPASIHNFVDLFAGGFNVGVNVKADCIFANDQIDYLIELYEYFQRLVPEIIRFEVVNQIESYSLSKENTEGYNKLRSDYNRNKNPRDLFVLTCYSFNHQIRFNNSKEFNTPFGKERSSFNKSIERNLVDFCTAIRNMNVKFSSFDFRKFDFSQLSEGDVVYCDPPYLITTGSYNDGNRGFGDWTEQEEHDLLRILDGLNAKGILFFLSNVLVHKGAENSILKQWSQNYYVKHINKNYSNCSYHLKNRNIDTDEVLISNYEGMARKEEECKQLTLF